MFDDLRRLVQVLDGSSAEAAAPAAPAEQATSDIDKNAISGSGPATNFRNAATDGVTVWGPIMGGIVAVGGSVALIGSLLAQKPSSQNA